MNKGSDSSTQAQPEHEAKLARLREAARRAVWDATEGPLHLRAGRYWLGHGNDETASSSESPLDDGQHGAP